MKYTIIATLLLLGACSGIEGDTSSYPLDNDDARHQYWRDRHNNPKRDLGV